MGGAREKQRQKGSASIKRRKQGFSGDRELFIRQEKFYSALANRVRLEILALLKKKAMFGFELVHHLGIGQSTVSYHLGLLKEVNLIHARQQDGGTLYFRAKGGKMP